MTVQIVARPVSVIARPSACKVLIAKAPVRIVNGGRGPAGPGGGGASSDIEAVAVGPLGGQRVVKAVAGGAGYASADTPGDADLIIGVTTVAAIDGATLKVRTAGEMQDPTFAWQLGAVFLGINGVLTQAPPSSGFIRQIGVAIAADTLVVDLRPPLILE